jgi:hypothetical protein
LTPAAPAKKPGEANKPAAEAGKDAKSKSGKDSAPTRRSRPANADLDGGPVPPAPVGSR